jgi:putative DNA primase/helicase
VRGSLEWQRAGLQEPKEVTEATACYKAEQNTVAQFLAERCTLNAQLCVRADGLRQAFEKWSNAEFTRNAFASLMEANGYKSVPDSSKCKIYKGIGLNSDTIAGDSGDFGA